MKFYLVHPKGDPALLQWMIKEGEKARNMNGGWMLFVMLTVVEEVEAKSWKDLDWKMVLGKPGSFAGYLSPFGEWHPCRRKGHDNYAKWVLKAEMGDLEDDGWVHVYGAPGTRDPWLCTVWPTPIQLRWLKENGYDISRYGMEYKKACRLLKVPEIKDERIN